MKYVTLIRHASASWVPGQPDEQRALTENGKQECLSIAKQLKHKAWLPDCIKVSPALRTQTTANMIIQGLPDTRIETEQTIYEAYYSTLIKMLQNTDNHIEHICLIGHNPGLSELGSYLSQGGVNLSPAHAVQFCFEIDTWANIADNTGKQTFLLTP